MITLWCRDCQKSYDFSRMDLRGKWTVWSVLNWHYADWMHFARQVEIKRHYINNNLKEFPALNNVSLHSPQS